MNFVYDVHKLDDDWGKFGLCLYVGRVLFKKGALNLFHWCLIIGQYNDPEEDPNG